MSQVSLSDLISVELVDTSEELRLRFADRSRIAVTEPSRLGDPVERAAGLIVYLSEARKVPELLTRTVVTLVTVTMTGWFARCERFSWSFPPDAPSVIPTRKSAVPAAMAPQRVLIQVMANRPLLVL
jgi:hypothetical protein